MDEAIAGVIPAIVMNTPWKEQRFNIALAQLAMTADPETNLQTALKFIEKAAKQGGDIICLPELFRSPYFCVHEHSERDYAEKVEPVRSQLSEAANKNGIAVIGGSIYELSDEGRRFNTSFVFNKDGTCLGSYRKMHIPHDPSFFEMNYFEPGDLGFRIFDLGVARVAVLICYDQWFPEAARAAALAGADVIFYPTAIGHVDNIAAVDGDWQNAWETVQRGHAIANSVIVAPVNRVGREGQTTFWGGSFICDAFGKILSKGGDEEELVFASVDLGHSEFTRNGWRFMESRRPDSYSALLSIL